MKAMKPRTIAVSLVLSVAVATGAWMTLQSVEDAEMAEVAQKGRFVQAKKQHEETVGVVQQLALKASSIDEWKDVLARANTLTGPEKDYFTQVGTIGMVESLAAERDRLFLNAGELLAANEKDSEAPKILDRARHLQDLADTFVQKLSAESKDPQWRLALQYRKAYEKYRSLAFLEPKEHDKALDIIDDALVNLRGANKAVPKDNKVEVAIEFLYKRAKEEESKKGSQKAPGTPRALPSRPGDGPGTGGADRQRRY